MKSDSFFVLRLTCCCRCCLSLLLCAFSLPSTIIINDYARGVWSSAICVSVHVSVCLSVCLHISKITTRSNYLVDSFNVHLLFAKYAANRKMERQMRYKHKYVNTNANMISHSPKTTQHRHESDDRQVATSVERCGLSGHRHKEVQARLVAASSHWAALARCTRASHVQAQCHDV